MDESLKAVNEDLTAWCAGMGIDVPPVPERFGAALRRHSPDAFATRELCWSPYDVQQWVTEEGASDYLSVGHAGHGVNSYAVSYFLVQRNLRLFIQVGLGGVYMDAEKSRRAVCEAFRGAARLIRGADGAPEDPPMFVVATDFYGSRWRAGLGSENESATVLECISDATAWLEAQR